MPSFFRSGEGARTVVALVAAVLLAGCATGPQLQPATPQTSLTLAEDGVRLIVQPNSWTGSPSTLPSYYTPVHVRIENTRTEDILVRYTDFLALDDAGNQYRAVAPAEVARALFGGRVPARPAPVPPLYAGPWWPYRPWGYWPYYGPPYFSPWWDSPYSPYPYVPAATPYDVLTLGLREGRVLPAAAVEGFVYLQQATQRANLLTLTWTPALLDGRPLRPLQVQLRLVR